MRLAIFVLTACCAFPSSVPAATWTEVRTPHYLLIGDARPGDIRRVAQRFEQFHAAMQRLLPRASVSLPTPTIVIVFRDQNSFRPYQPRYGGKPMETAGFALTGGSLNYIALAADGETAYPVVFHELAHLITSNVAPGAPTWLSEGIAEYYSSFEMRGDDEVILGGPIGRHVLLLRARFMPLRELFAVDTASPAYNEQDRATIFYAESWALVHYLRFNPATAGRLNEFVMLSSSGTPHEQALERAFGLDTARLEQALRQYVRQFIMMAERLTLDAPVTEARMSTADLDERVALPHLAALLMRTGQTAEAERRLKAAAQAAPTSATVHAALATLRLGQGRPADALAALRPELTSDGFLDDYMVASALAQCLSGFEAWVRSDDARVSALRKRATAAAESQRDVAEAWRLAAFAHFLADDVDEAARAIERALALAPANEDYRFMQAEVLARRREFARARGTLGTLLARGRTPEVRARARRMLATIAASELAARPPGGAEKVEEAAPPAREPADESRSSPGGGSIPVFRNVEADETRVFGSLVAIECRPGRVTLVLRVADRMLRASTASFDRIDFISFRDDLKGQVGCATRTPPDPVYVTWRGTDGGAAELHTESVVVEFTPRGFTPP